MRFATAATIVGAASVSSARVQVPSRRYECRDLDTNGGRGCAMLPRGSSSEKEGMSQGACQLTCSPMLWPLPTGDIVLGNEVAALDVSSIVLGSTSRGASEPLQKAYFDTFRSNVLQLYPDVTKSSGQARLVVNIDVVESNLRALSIDVDESYELKLSSSDSSQIIANVRANTVFGARHALETLAQFTAWDDAASVPVVLRSAAVTDAPAFRYRGALLDLSRHFLSLDTILTTIKALSFNKMNVLHLHIADTASFPLELTRQPNITAYGAYGPKYVYTPDMVQRINDFALLHGVLVLPEIDTPAHVGAGWEWGADAGLGDLVLCADPEGSGGEQWLRDSLEPPSGQLNIVNTNAMNVLRDVYYDVVGAFAGASGGLFHLGGDEVIVGSDTSSKRCYNSTSLGAPIIDYLERNGFDRSDPESFYGLWQNFTQSAAGMVVDAFRDSKSPFSKLHLWGGGGIDSSGGVYNLIERDDVVDVLPPSLFTFQIWDTVEGSLTKTLIEKGYDIVLSNTDYVYLDCGGPGFTNPGGYWCQPYHEWFHIYNYIADVKKEWKLTKQQVKKIIGSETLVWGELIDDQNVHQKLWPRTAALAEALWSDPSAGWYEADPRMQWWRNVLVARGVPAEALQPLWCQQRSPHACTLNAGEPQ